MTLTVRTSRIAGLALAGSLLLVPVISACSSSSTPSASPTAASSSPASGDASPTVTSESGAKPVLSDGEAPADRTILVSKDAFTPASLTIAVNQNVTFKASGSGVFGVEVGGLDSVTVTGGLVETYTFPAAGEYAVTESVSGNTATIIVK